MELSAGLLVLICATAGVVAAWHSNLAAREAANRAAIAACEDLRLQFLDGTVAFARARIARCPTGWLTLRRTYVFDYTADSIARRRGFVVLTGVRVDSVGFEQDERSAPRSGPTDIHGRTPAPGRRSETVLMLEDWRPGRPESRAGRGTDRPAGPAAAPDD